MQIKLTGIDDTFAALKGLDDVRSKIGAVTQDVYENVRFYAKPHHASGTLESNIRHKITPNAGVVFIDDKNMLVDWKGRRVNYAWFVIEGTKPHYIRPKRRRALRFYGNLEAFVYAKSVKHPGYEGDDFLKKALTRTMSRLDRLLKG